MVFCGGDGWFWGCDGEEADGFEEECGRRWVCEEADGFWEKVMVVLMVEEGDGFGRG